MASSVISSLKMTFPGSFRKWKTVEMGMNILLDSGAIGKIKCDSNLVSEEKNRVNLFSKIILLPVLLGSLKSVADLENCCWGNCSQQEEE